MSEKNENKFNAAKARSVVACVFGFLLIGFFLSLIIINTSIIISTKDNGLPEFAGTKYCLCTELGNGNYQNKLFVSVIDNGKYFKDDKIIYKTAAGYSMGYLDHISEKNGKLFAVVRQYPESKDVLVLPDFSLRGKVDKSFPVIGDVIAVINRFKLAIAIGASLLILYEAVSMFLGIAKFSKKKKKGALKSDNIAK